MGALDVFNDKELEMLKVPSMGPLDVCIAPLWAKIDLIYHQNGDLCLWKKKPHIYMDWCIRAFERDILEVNQAYQITDRVTGIRHISFKVFNLKRLVSIFRFGKNDRGLKTKRILRTNPWASLWVNRS
jgi:hypothetical protein